MYLIIGYGSPLRSDDRLGQHLAEMLGNGRNIITSTQLTPELAEPVSRAERVVFLDARWGETPGEIVHEYVEPIRTTDALTHNVTPASLLAAAQELYGAAPQALLISVVGASFDYGVTFSPQIDALLPEIIKTIDEIITIFFTAKASP